MTSGRQTLPPPPPVGHLTVFRAKDPNYVAIFVEGQDDVDTWKPWLKWPPVPAGGCSFVRAAVESLRAAGAEGFVGLIDANCERLEGRNHSTHDIIVTQDHDLECDLLKTPALERLLGSVDDAVIAAVTAGQPIRDALAARAIPFGFLRWYFFRIGHKYEDGRLSPYRFIDRNNWVLDEQALIAEAALVLGQPVQMVIDELTKLRALKHSEWHICNGHDLLSVLTIALSGPLRAASKFPHDRAVSNSLRLALDSVHRQEMYVWQALLAWQSKNPPWITCAP